jgi:hypothetical protein
MEDGMRSQPSKWSLVVVLAALIFACVAAGPAFAQQSGKMRIKGTYITSRQSLLTYSNLTGTFDTNCFSKAPKPNLGDSILVGVAKPDGSGGWSAAETHTFLLNPSAGEGGKQFLVQYNMPTYGLTLFVTVTQENSCGGESAWIITFTQEQGPMEPIVD